MSYVVHKSIFAVSYYILIHECMHKNTNLYFRDVGFPCTWQLWYKIFMVCDLRIWKNNVVFYNGFLILSKVVFVSDTNCVNFKYSYGILTIVNRTFFL